MMHRRSLTESFNKNQFGVGMFTSSKANSLPRTRNVKAPHFFCVVTALVSMAGASTAMAAQPPDPKDLTLGVWELQVDKSKFCTPAPKKSTREIIDAGWGLISVHWTGIDAKGKPMDIRYVWRYDGQKYPAEIIKPAKEAITWKLVSPTRVEFTHWTKDNQITQELLRIVSSDGQTMTQTTKYVGGKEGKECVDTQVFQRQ